MRSTGFLFFLALGALACGSNNDLPADAPLVDGSIGPDAAVQTACGQAIAAAAPLIDQDNHCTVPSDCKMIYGERTCDIAVALDFGVCNAAANAVAYDQDPQLQAAITKIYQVCSERDCYTPGVTCVEDCAPPPGFDCVDGRCRPIQRFCHQPDAGLTSDAAPMAD